MSLTEIIMVYSITNTTLTKCISLIRENTNFSRHTVILLCEYITKLHDIQKLIVENLSEIIDFETGTEMKKYISGKVTECAEIEKRISEETPISLYTH